MNSIYGFAQMAAPAGSGVTNALRLYARAVAQGADKTGAVSNPDVYRQARETFLAPLGDNIQISTQIAQSTNDENRLRDKQNDTKSSVSQFEANFNDALSAAAKNFYSDPKNLVLKTSELYNSAADAIGNEIEVRTQKGESVEGLQSMLNDYSEKADKISRLARQVLATDKPSNPNAYGWYAKTNPDDGSIISLELDGVDSTNKQSGYMRTNQYYGNIPVWTNTMTDDKGVVTARIGQNKYELTDDKSGGSTVKVLKNVGKQYGGFFKGYLPGGETPDQVKEKNRTLNLGGVQFGDVLKLPTGSVAKDGSGNYYYYGSDGVYKAPSKDNMVKFMNNTGLHPGDIDAQSFPISRNEVQGIGSFVDADGKSRIIDDKFLNATATPAAPQAALPPLTQPVKGTISAAPAPTVPAAPAAAPAFEVPRKQPGVKEPSKVGEASVKDSMAAQASKVMNGTGLGVLADAAKKMFGG